MNHTALKYPTTFTSDALTEFAGYPVCAFDPSELPHHEAIRRGTANAAQIEERTTAVYAELTKRTMTKAQVGFFNFAEARASAIYVSPHIQKKFFLDRFDLASCSHFSVTHPIIVPKNGRSIVVPYDKCEPVTDLKIWISCAAIFMMNPANQPAIDHWQKFTKLPPHLLHVPPTNHYHVHWAKMHEARHLMHGDLLTPRGEFYRELDADRFASAILRSYSDPAAREATIASRHGRYLGLFTPFPQYWFAPALDAVEADKDPPLYDEIRRSVLEIQFRLVEAALCRMRFAPKSKALHRWARSAWNEDQQRSFLSRLLSPRSLNLSGSGSLLDFNNTIYIPKLSKGQDPASVYSLLREITDRGVFTDPLTQQIAHKIVTAAEYFSPGLTRAPNPRAAFQAPRAG